MNTTDNPSTKAYSCSSLGKVAQRIGISRAYLSERLHVEVRGHDLWPSMQRINGQYSVGSYLLAARLAKLAPRPVYDAVGDPSPEEAYVLIECATLCLAQLVGVEGEPYCHTMLEREDLVAFLRALGDVLTASLAGMKKPDGYDDESQTDGEKDEP